MTGSVIRDNTAGSGGEVGCCGANGEWSKAAIAGHGGRGGGVYAAGALTIATSTVSGNTTGNGGGAACCVAQAGHGGSGGGVYAGGEARLVQSTVTANNTGTGGGAGCCGAAPGSPGAGGGVATGGATLTLTATIVAGNQAKSSATAATADCGSTVASGGHNLVGFGTGCPSGGAGDQAVAPASIFADVLMQTLADNGGPTKTHALTAHSPAIDGAGAGSSCTAPSPAGASGMDQRGFARPFGAACDVGAVEQGAPLLAATLTLTHSALTYGGETTTTLTATLTVTLTGAPLVGQVIVFTFNGSAACGGGGQPTCPSTNASGVATLTVAVPAGPGAGSYPNTLGASFAGDATYAPSSATAALRIGKRLLWVRPVAQSHQRGVVHAGCPTTASFELAPNPPAGTGLVNGDTLAGVLSIAPGVTNACTYTVLANAAPGTYQNAIWGYALLAANYELRYKGGTLTITP